MKATEHEQSIEYIILYLLIGMMEGVIASGTTYFISKLNREI
jgi:hypothetical protein